MEADNKARLEDIYLPFKPKRRTKAQIAIESGLGPLADMLLSSPDKDPKVEAGAFVDAEKNVATVEAALEGARAILVERFAEDADLIGALREIHWSQAVMKSKPREGKEAAAREIFRLLRVLAAHLETPVASHSGAVSRREGRNAGARNGAGGGARPRRL